MTLPASGNPISLSQVDVELGQSATAQISLNCTSVRTLFGVACGAISMSNGYGKSIVCVDVAYTTPGTYSWIAPACVTSVSVVVVGAGQNGARGCSFGTAGGAGGALAYKNNISVTSGNSYTVKVARSLCACACCGTGSYFNSTSTVRAAAKCVRTGDGGGNGGNGGNGNGAYAGGGGGAGGYSGNGGNGGRNGACGTSGSGGGGAGGRGDFCYPCGGAFAGGGGGVGIYGQGSNGVYGIPSGGGSGGTSGLPSGNCSAHDGKGGFFGGGGSGLALNGSGSGGGAIGGSGAVRIVGPGGKRQFPSTCVGTTKGSALFTNCGSYTWIAPPGVTSVSVVAVGGGAAGGAYMGGGGGGLGYRNNISVTPGNSYLVYVGSGGNFFRGGSGTTSYFITYCDPSIGTSGHGGYGNGNGFCCTIGGTHSGTGGGNGGGSCGCGGGGGAGGYSGNGGKGGYNGTAGSGGGGGGGGRYSSCGGSGGGGVGLYGQGTNGSGASSSSSLPVFGGGGGSGGSAGCNVTTQYHGGNGGLYGGGGGATNTLFGGVYFGNGAPGAVRIIWPGSTRSFPSTCVGNP